MNCPEISVLMSVFNSDKYLSEAIESITLQSFINLEFIIIDDGSSDKTANILDHYQNIDERISLLKNRNNIGLAASLNKAIKLARGKYIARQDADDISLFDRLQKQYIFMENNNIIHLLGSNRGFIDMFGNHIYDDYSYSNITDFSGYLLNNKAIFPHGSAFMRKKALLDLGMYDERFYYSQDGELWLRFLKGGYKIAVYPEILYYFRITPSVNMNKGIAQKKYNRIKNMIYASHYESETQSAIINKEFKDVEKYIKKTRNEFQYNYLSKYWLYISTIAIREKSNRLYIWKCLIRSFRYKDTTKNNLLKILLFVVSFIPFFPYKILIKGKKYI